MASRWNHAAANPKLGAQGSVWRDLAWILEDGRRLVRMLCRNARYSLLALVLMGAGIGANVATVGIVRNEVLPRLKDARANAVVSVWQSQLESLRVWPVTGSSCGHVTGWRWIRLRHLRWT